MTLGSAKSEDPRLSAVKLFSKYFNLRNHNGGAEIASTGKCKYGKVKYKVAKCVPVENTSRPLWKIKVRVSRVGKGKYGKIEYGITVQLLEIR